MKIVLLAAGAASLALIAGQAPAAAPVTTSPKQPIPYSQLNAYLKASPKQRMSRDWSAAASTGAAANTSATAATPSLPADTAPPQAASPSPAPGDDAKSPTSPLTVNPSSEAPPPSDTAPPPTAPGAPPPTTPPK